MAEFSGRKISVGIGKETVRGTAVAASYWVKHLDLDFIDKNEKVLNESALGVLDKFSQVEIVKEWAEGKLEGKVTDKTFGLILASLFGQVPTSVQRAAEGVYDHTYVQNQTNTGLSLTISRKDPNADKRYALAVLNKLEIECVVGEFIKFSAEYVSKKGVTTANTTAYVAENEFVPKNAVAKFAANLAGIGAASAIPVKSFKLSMERSVEPYFAFGSNEPAEIYNQEFEVKGDMTLRYINTTYEDLWRNNTSQAVDLNIINTGVVIGSGASNPAVKFTLPEANVIEWDVDQSKDKIVEQTVGFQGLYNLAAAATLTAVLTNTQASY